jgi:hypothetical protein
MIFQKWIIVKWWWSNEQAANKNVKVCRNTRNFHDLHLHYSTKEKKKGSEEEEPLTQKYRKFTLTHRKIPPMYDKSQHFREKRTTTTKQLTVQCNKHNLWHCSRCYHSVQLNTGAAIERVLDTQERPHEDAEDVLISHIVETSNLTHSHQAVVFCLVRASRLVGLNVDRRAARIGTS